MPETDPSIQGPVSTPEVGGPAPVGAQGQPGEVANDYGVYLPSPISESGQTTDIVPYDPAFAGQQQGEIIDAEYEIGDEPGMDVANDQAPTQPILEADPERQEAMQTLANLLGAVATKAEAEIDNNNTKPLADLLIEDAPDSTIPDEPSRPNLRLVTDEDTPEPKPTFDSSVDEMFGSIIDKTKFINWLTNRPEFADYTHGSPQEGPSLVDIFSDERFFAPKGSEDLKSFYAELPERAREYFDTWGNPENGIKDVYQSHPTNGSRVAGGYFVGGIRTSGEVLGDQRMTELKSAIPAYEAALGDPRIDPKEKQLIEQQLPLIRAELSRMRSSSARKTRF